MRFFNEFFSLFSKIRQNYQDYLRKSAVQQQQTALVQAAANQKKGLHAQGAAYYRMYYNIIVQLLMEAINNTAPATGLHRVQNARQLVFNPPVILRNGYFQFQFRLWAGKGITLTASDLAKILQQELDVLCSVYRFPRLKIEITYKGDGAIIFRVALWSDIFGGSGGIII